MYFIYIEFIFKAIYPFRNFYADNSIESPFLPYFTTQTFSYFTDFNFSSLKNIWFFKQKLIVIQYFCCCDSYHNSKIPYCKNPFFFYLQYNEFKF